MDANELFYYLDDATLSMDGKTIKVKLNKSDDRQTTFNLTVKSYGLNARKAVRKIAEETMTTDCTFNGFCIYTKSDENRQINKIYLTDDLTTYSDALSFGVVKTENCKILDLRNKSNGKVVVKCSSDTERPIGYLYCLAEDGDHTGHYKYSFNYKYAFIENNEYETKTEIEND